MRGVLVIIATVQLTLFATSVVLIPEIQDEVFESRYSLVLKEGQNALFENPRSAEMNKDHGFRSLWFFFAFVKKVTLLPIGTLKSL